jgi:LacI family transcriptional regulator
VKSGSKVYLRQISEETGLSRMAVSLALRGKAGVSEANRKKILKLAEKMGYQPDPEVAKLMSRLRQRQSTETRACLALLTSGDRPDDWKKFTTERNYVVGAQNRAKEYGYHLERFWIQEKGMTATRLGQIIWNRGIEGIIIAPLQGKLSETSNRSLQLDFSPFSVVEISETIQWPNLDRSNHDQFTSMQITLQELFRLNYQKPGLVLESSLDRRVNGRWTAAFLEARNRQGTQRLAPPLLLNQHDPSTFERWLKKNKPDAIISVDRFGLKLLETLKLKFPKDIGYATLDVDGVSSDYPDISGIDQNSHLVGAAAVDMVVSAIHRGQRGIPEHSMRTEIEGTWKSGSSTRRQASRAS